MTSFTFTHLEQGDLRLSVTFDYSRGRPGVHTLPNGDPGYPDEPDELELTSVTIERKDPETRLWTALDIDLLGWVFDVDDAVAEKIGEAAYAWLESEWARDQEPDYYPDDNDLSF